MSRPRLFPILIAGLPLGLIVLGAVAMWLYFHKGADVVEPTAAMSGILRKEITADGIDRYQHIFTEVLGARPVGDVDALSRTFNYLESTLGPRNLGYAVVRLGTGNADNLIAYQRGGRRPREVVLVAAPYAAGDDTLVENSSALTMLLSVAAAKTGGYTDRSIAIVLSPEPVPDSDALHRSVLEALDVSGRGQLVARVDVTATADQPPTAQLAAELDDQISSLVAPRDR